MVQLDFFSLTFHFLNGILETVKTLGQQQLLEKARSSNAKSNRLLVKIQCEIKKRSTKMATVMKWQEKSAKYVKRGLGYMNEFDALGEEKNVSLEKGMYTNLDKCFIV